MAQVADTSHVAPEHDSLGAQIQTCFSMESYATKMNVSGRSREDKRALEQLEKTQKLVDGHYKVGLRRTKNNATIQNNYSWAQSQFCSLEQRLQKNASLQEPYEITINVYLQNAYVRKLHEKEMDETKHDSLWFWPHHPVINPFKPYRARCVCNAAASYKGESLNYKLLTVIDLLQNLMGINFRFREHQIAFSMHIEALYLQVKVPPQNCRLLRFL